MPFSGNGSRNPANDYVAEFTREIPRPKVLSVRSVMLPLDGKVKCLGSVSEDTKIEDLASRVFKQKEPIAVIDEKENAIGQITQAVVLEVLIKKDGG